MNRIERLEASGLSRKLSKSLSANFISGGKEPALVVGESINLSQLWGLYVEELPLSAQASTGIKWDCTIAKITFEHVTFSGELAGDRNVFSTCKFINCTFDRCIMQSVLFSNCEFLRSSFRRTDLTRAELSNGCQFLQTTLADCYLNNSVWNDSKGINDSQFARSDLTGAALPGHVAEFAIIAHANEAAKSNKRLMFLFVLGCTYTLLTVASTPDTALFTNSLSISLPIVQTKIPVMWFYNVVPLLLLAMFIYLQVGLQRYWECIASLPAYFPDGQSIESHTHPWIFTGLVRSYFFRLRRLRPIFHPVQFVIIVALGWAIAPMLQAVILFRVQFAHDTILTWVHSLAFFGIFVFALLSFSECRRTLRQWLPHSLDETQRPSREANRRLITYGVIALIATVAISAVYTSKYRLFLPDFRDQVLRGLNFSGRNMEGVLLSGADLTRANFSRASLRHADLSFATIDSVIADSCDLGIAQLSLARGQASQFRGATLDSVDMSQARLANCDFSGSTFVGANLRQANLSGSVMKVINLEGFDFTSTNLSGVDFTGSSLSYANFSQCDLTGAKLGSASLRGANFTGTLLNGCEWEGTDVQGLDYSAAVENYGQEIQKARNWVLAKYHRSWLELVNLDTRHNERLDKRDLSGYDLSGQDLRFARFVGFNLRNCNFAGSVLDSASLNGADLTGATGLSADQVALTTSDSETRWPLGLFER